MLYDILSSQFLEDLMQEQPNRIRRQAKAGEYVNLIELEMTNPAGINEERIKKLAKIMRGLMFSSLEASQSGHPGGSSAKVEQFLSLVLGGNLAFDPMNPKNPGRDRVVWSAGHCSPALYSGLALLYECLRRSGRQFSSSALRAVLPEDLVKFRSHDGPQGHIENYYPLSDIATGPSGHGLSAAGGLALVQRSCGLKTKVWCFMGDAESEEGMTYEARNVLAKCRAENLIVSLDYNHFGIDGPIEEVIDSPYYNHWLGMGWNVIEINGHSINECANAYGLAAIGFGNGRPTVILAHCIKGKFYGANENSNKSHGSPAKHDEYVKIMKDLGFNIKGEKCNVMDDIEKTLEHLEKDDVAYVATRMEESTKRIVSEGKLIEAMKTALVGRSIINPRTIKRPDQLPPELVFNEGDKIATRKATSAWFSWLMKQSAFFYCGTGDLSCSILMDSAEDMNGLITKDNPLGRGIRFGIAEQNMAMMSIAMTQDILPGGYQPVSVFGTYGVFTSMMSNCVRLGLIGNHLFKEHSGFFIMLAAHDGPETGEDGPTHQGLYWMSMFNAYPGIKVYKPFDANETIEMLFYALEKGEPIALSVMRPDTPVLKRGNGVPFAREAVNGAYVYKKFNNDGKQKTILAISGTQTLLNTLEALPDLEQELDIKIIAVTSPELFEDLKKENPEKAKEILPDEERSLVICLHNGWKGFLYPFMLPSDYQEKTIAVENYLKSGNVKDVYELAGLSPKDIKEKIIKIVKKI
ncbi:MAG: 1-deoxy-D-xylulose-5-phosphate synthase N-terminal domain-containing protein [bacterium]